MGATVGLCQEQDVDGDCGDCAGADLWGHWTRPLPEEQERASCSSACRTHQLDFAAPSGSWDVEKLCSSCQLPSVRAQRWKPPWKVDGRSHRSRTTVSTPPPPLLLACHLGKVSSCVSLSAC
ncbi:Ig-like domain-containing protein [Podarcis lilfordi]|uniref:Ig-like domain-containing protein n=1 Tax=Podarcis lilfordi TaxID=74358 RepID=A0AA35NYG8_9SAUR|nr:Ig-like domain-containing protein [Podarcis lilfordi]